jgi:sugar (pentulose or hexulose) kinase
MKNNILAIDCGTQSLRGLVFNESGQLMESEKVQYEPYQSPNPG